MTNTKTSSGAVLTAVGSSGPAAALASLLKSRSRSHCTWQDVNPQLLAEALTRVVESGSLISFGRTSDGGALMLSIVTDGAASKFYATHDDEAEVLLREVTTAFEQT